MRRDKTLRSGDLARLVVHSPARSAWIHEALPCPGINSRMTPILTSASLVVIERNRKQKFVHVILSDGRIGWIHESWIELIPKAEVLGTCFPAGTQSDKGT